MKVRRLISVLLVLLLALPLAASAEEVFLEILSVSVQQTDEMGNTGFVPLDPSQYLVGYANEDPNSLWIQLLDPSIPSYAVQVIASYLDTETNAIKQYYVSDYNTGSDVLDLSMSAMGMMQYGLKEVGVEDAMVQPAPFSLVMSTDPAPTLTPDPEPDPEPKDPEPDPEPKDPEPDPEPKDPEPDPEPKDPEPDPGPENVDPPITVQSDSLNTQQTDPEPLGENWELGYGKVGDVGAVLYNQPNGQQISALPKDTVVHYLQNNEAYPDYTDPSTGERWVPVVLDDYATYGYVKMASFRFLPEEEIRTSVQGTNTTYVRINTDSAALLDANGNELGTYLSGGDTVTFLADQAGSVKASPVDGSLLMLVQLENGQTGYIRQAGNYFLNSQAAQDYNDSRTEKLPDVVTGYVTVKSGGATMLNDSGSSMGMVAEGKVLKYLGETRSDNSYKLWLKVTVDEENGATGYVALNNVDFFSQADSDARDQSKKQQLSTTRETDFLRISATDAKLEDGTNRILQDLTQGAVVQLVSGGKQYYDSNDRLWVEVKVDDSTAKQGYVKLDNTTYMTKADVANHESSKNQQMPKPDSNYADVTKAGASLVSSSFNAIQSLSVGTTLRYNEGTTPLYDSDHKLWISATVDMVDGKVVQNGSTGYVKYDLVQFKTADQAKKYEEDKAKADASPTKEDPTPTKAEPTPTLMQQSGFMRVASPQLYAELLASPRSGGWAVGYVTRGDVVYVQSQALTDGVTWSYVQPQNSTTAKTPGYIPASYLVSMSLAEINAYFDSINKPVITPSPAPTYSPNTFSGYGILTSGGVNFRTTASMSSGTISRLAKNTMVRILSQTTAEGYTWYYVESAGKTGYIRSDMMTPLTVREYELLVTSPSYNNNGNIITPTSTVGVSTWTAKPGANSTITFVTLPPMSSASPGASASASASPDVSASASADPSASPTGAFPGGITETPDPNATLSPDATDPNFEQQETSGGFPIGTVLIILVILLVLATGGVYGYSIYNKNRRKQQEERNKQAMSAANKNGEKPATRRPVPPTQPGQPGQAKPGQPGQTKPGQPGQPGSQRPTAPGAQGTKPGAPTAPGQTRPTTGTPGQAQGQQGRPTNPYARPTQDVSSTMPRASVDGKPVGQGGQQPGNPYARPANQPGQAGQPPQPGQPGTPTQRTPTQGSTPPTGTTPGQGSERTQRMPIAPEPVKPDGADTDAPPRRRRRQHLETNGGTEGATKPEDTTKKDGEA